MLCPGEDRERRGTAERLPLGWSHYITLLSLAEDMDPIRHRCGARLDRVTLTDTNFSP